MALLLQTFPYGLPTFNLEPRTTNLLYPPTSFFLEPPLGGTEMLDMETPSQTATQFQHAMDDIQQIVAEVSLCKRLQTYCCHEHPLSRSRPRHRICHCRRSSGGANRGHSKEGGVRGTYREHRVSLCVTVVDTTTYDALLGMEFMAGVGGCCDTYCEVFRHRRVGLDGLTLTVTRSIPQITFLHVIFIRMARGFDTP